MGIGRSKEERVICVGLDNAGKSTIINKIKPQKLQVRDTAATVGFNEEVFKYQKTLLTVYDMSGQSRYRLLWEQQYKHVTGIVFVIDSSDPARMCVAREELDTILTHDAIQTSGCPILFFCNKSDAASSLKPAEILKQMGCQEIRGRQWHAQTSNALSGEGLEEGMQWLLQAIAQHRKQRT